MDEPVSNFTGAFGWCKKITRHNSNPSNRLKRSKGTSLCQSVCVRENNKENCSSISNKSCLNCLLFPFPQTQTFFFLKSETKNCTEFNIYSISLGTFYTNMSSLQELLCLKLVPNLFCNLWFFCIPAISVLREAD